MNLSRNTADSVRKFTGIWSNGSRSGVACHQGPTILFLSSSHRLSVINGFRTYIDVDILVASVFQSKRNERVGCSQNLGFTDS